MTGTLSYSWSSDPRIPDDLTVRGTGAPLTLARTAGRGLTNGSSDVHVETTVQADYEPVTATVRGRVGDTVKVRLGLRDHGPGRLIDSEELGRFEVVPPQGTTVTSIPFTFEDSGGTWACKRPEKPGGAFVCDIGYDGFSEVRHEGGTTAIGFHVRIDRQVPGARGTIRTYNPYDRTPGNNTAVIPLDASPAPPHRKPVIRATGFAGAVAVVVLVALYRRRRRVSWKPCFTWRRGARSSLMVPTYVARGANVRGDGRCGAARGLPRRSAGQDSPPRASRGSRRRGVRSQRR